VILVVNVNSRASLFRKAPYFLHLESVSYLVRVLYCRDAEEREKEIASWCGWHFDHGSLTGIPTISLIYVLQSSI
jgi:hypothetical protein